MSASACCAAILLGSTVANAQPAVSPSRLVLGAMGSWTVTSARNAARGTAPDFAVNVDVSVVSGFRVRGELGRARVEFDGIDLLGAPLPVEKISVTRFTGAALQTLDLGPEMYVGLGFGAYRMSSNTSPPSETTRTGVHFLVGLEIPVLASGLVARLEAQWQFVNGEQGPEPDAPVTGAGAPELRSRLGVIGNPLNLVWGLGIGWRF